MWIEDINEAIFDLRTQEAISRDGLRQSLALILEYRIVSIGDCPVDEIEPTYERENTHRVVNEDDIVDIITEDYEKEESQDNDKNEDIEEDLISLKRTYSVAEKIEYLSKLLDIFEEDDIDNNVKE